MQRSAAIGPLASLRLVHLLLARWLLSPVAGISTGDDGRAAGRATVKAAADHFAGVKALLRQNEAFELSAGRQYLRPSLRWNSSASDAPASEGPHVVQLLEEQVALRQQQPNLTGLIPEDPMSMNSTERHEMAAGVVFLIFAMMIVCLVPLVCSERRRWELHVGSGATDSRHGDRGKFSEYLEYRFIEWFTTSPAGPAILLLVLTLLLVVTGALAYSLLVGGTPTQAMYKIFIFTTAASADREKKLGGRFLAIIVTVCGLIILSLLLGMVAEAFANWMSRARMGMHDVHEGGHTVVLGYSPAAKFLVQEMAHAAESEGGQTIVILARTPKVEVEDEIATNNVNLRNSKLIVRSGSPCDFSALKSVAADKAKTLVLISDQPGLGEEAHEEIMCTLLALKSRGWPLNSKGKIIVQCATDLNRQVLKSVYPSKVEVVVIADIVAKLMVQSAFQPGIAHCFDELVGFEGSDLYVKEWPQLKGKTFRFAYYHIPDGVVMGIFTRQGKCRLNPSGDYIIQKGDRIIVMAEDDDKYQVEAKPFYPYQAAEAPTWAEVTRSPSHSFSKIEKDSNVLIIGWNKLAGSLLSALDKRTFAGHPSKVTIYSEHPTEERVDELNILERRCGHKLDNLIIQHVEVDAKDMTIHDELRALEHGKCTSIFVLSASDRCGGPDKMNVAIMAHLQALGKWQSHKNRFRPVVEIQLGQSKEYLKVLGLDNLVHSSSLVSKALASVAYQPEINEICNDLVSMRDNELSILSLSEFLPPYFELPKSISFGEAAFYVNSAMPAILIGWSPWLGEAVIPGDQDVILNPSDKITKRPWTPDDRVVVLIRLDNPTAHSEGQLTTRSMCSIGTDSIASIGSA